MKHAKDISLCALLLSLSFLITAAGTFCITAEKVLKSIPAQLDTQITRTRTEVLNELHFQADSIRESVLGEVDKQAGEIQKAAAVQIDMGLLMTHQHLNSLEELLDKRTSQALYLADARAGELTHTAEAFRKDVQPTLVGIDQLTGSYAALPGQLGEVLKPSWEALEPEITCRTLAGAGYGGCWHSRITGLFGEAERVGGVFTQKFPAFSDSVTGIAADVHTATHHYLAPGPPGWKGRLGQVGKITLGLGTAALRGGVF